MHAPFKALLPMVEPNDIVLGGWDFCGLNMAEAMERAQVRVLCVRARRGRQGAAAARTQGVAVCGRCSRQGRP